jgi:hypothetical protein
MYTFMCVCVCVCVCDHCKPKRAHEDTRATTVSQTLLLAEEQRLTAEALPVSQRLLLAVNPPVAAGRSVLPQQFFT